MIFNEELTPWRILHQKQTTGNSVLFLNKRAGLSRARLNAARLLTARHGAKRTAGGAVEGGKEESGI